jgi:thioredoxin-like negative regulator of GroEL
MSIPMQLFFTKGQQVDSILGATPEQNIRRVVDGLIQNNPKDNT